jgi:formylglycine-generating enzyme required for sulfatase activity
MGGNTTKHLTFILNIVLLPFAVCSLKAAEADLNLIDSPAKAKAAQTAWAAKLGKPMQWTNSVGMTFQLIPAGEFMMGSPSGQADETPHEVRLTRPFYMSTTKITRTQWTKVLGTVHSERFPGPNMPMICVHWYDANQFAGALSKLDKVNYRLPTEAEWEFAARAGSTTAYYTGDTEADLDKAAWYVKNSGSTLHPVAQKAPNAFGLYDMLGDTWEWCNDYYDKDYYGRSPVEDPTGPKLSLYGYRVVRGGSIYFSAAFCRTTHRDYYQDSRMDKHFGCRIVLPVATAPVTPAK